MPAIRSAVRTKREPRRRATRGRHLRRLLALPATAVAACAFGSPASAGANLLYSQYDRFDPSAPVSAATVTGTNAVGWLYAADDFVVPSGHAWTIRQVDVRGGFVGGEPAAGRRFVVTFSKDRDGRPGDYLDQAIAVAVTGSTPKDIELRDLRNRWGVPMVLGAGRHWLNVTAYSPFAQQQAPWGWFNRSAVSGRPATWTSGFSGPVGVPVAAPCYRGWGYRATDCHMDEANPDQVFRIWGTATAATR